MLVDRAMKETILKQMPCTQFFARLSRDSLFGGFVQYLAVRIADQQQVIANLVTVGSEQRLGKTLLRLAQTLGKKDPRSIRIELTISHEELSEMVGTTRFGVAAVVLIINLLSGRQKPKCVSIRLVGLFLVNRNQAL